MLNRNTIIISGLVTASIALGMVAYRIYNKKNVRFVPSMVEDVGGTRCEETEDSG